MQKLIAIVLVVTVFGVTLAVPPDSGSIDIRMRASIYNGCVTHFETDPDGNDILVLTKLLTGSQLRLDTHAQNWQPAIAFDDCILLIGLKCCYLICDNSLKLLSTGNLGLDGTITSVMRLPQSNRLVAVYTDWDAITKKWTYKLLVMQLQGNGVKTVGTYDLTRLEYPIKATSKTVFLRYIDGIDKVELKSD